VCYNTICEIGLVGRLEIEDMTRKWNPPDSHNLINLYSGGASIAELARQHGVARRTITARLIERGATIRTAGDQQITDYRAGSRLDLSNRARSAHKRNCELRRLPTSKKASLLYQSGKSVTEIAVQLGRTRRHISRCLREVGIAPARGGGSPSLTRLNAIAMSRSRVIGAGEAEVAQALADLGEVADAQHPWDSHNLDFAIPEECIAVEVIRDGACKGGRPKLLRKLERLVNAGWRVLLVYSHGRPTVRAARQYLRAGLQILRGHPAVRGCYGVIRCDESYRVWLPKPLEFDHLPRVSIPEGGPDAPLDDR